MQRSIVIGATIIFAVVAVISDSRAAYSQPTVQEAEFLLANQELARQELALSAAEVAALHEQQEAERQREHDATLEDVEQLRSSIEQAIILAQEAVLRDMEQGVAEAEQQESQAQTDALRFYEEQQADIERELQMLEEEFLIDQQLREEQAVEEAVEFEVNRLQTEEDEL